MRGLNLRKMGVGVALAGLVGALSVGCGHRGNRSGHGMWGHHGGERDVEEVKGHVEKMTGWALDKVDANSEQEEKIKAIVGEAVEELVHMGEEHRRNRDAFVAVFSQASIDAAAVEKLRQKELLLADGASAIMTRVLTDVGRVLTVEQRQELIEYAQAHHR